MTNKKKGYWVAKANVVAPDKQQNYGKLAEEVLEKYGNISSVTIFVVLMTFLNDSLFRGNFLMSALGPGFTAGLAEVEIK